eukprot:m51a1_g11312 hypothetical protein (653) ;mRNA; r:95344-98603
MKWRCLEHAFCTTQRSEFVKHLEASSALCDIQVVNEANQVLDQGREEIRELRIQMVLLRRRDPAVRALSPRSASLRPQSEPLCRSPPSMAETSPAIKLIGSYIHDLKSFFREHCLIPYDPDDLFLDLPEDVDPAPFSAYLARGSQRTLDPKKKLDAEFFDALGKETIEIHIRPGAEPLPVPPPAAVSVGVSTIAPFSLRDQTCSELLEFVENRRNVTLVRAPPRSGKTALISLFGDYLAVNRPDSEVHAINLSKVLLTDYKNIEHPITRLIEQECGGSVRVSELDKKRSRQLFLLCDETQSVYHFRNDAFWVMVKVLLQRTTDLQTYLVLFATHGGVFRTEFQTPFESVGNELTVSFLWYRSGELEELAGKFNEFAREKRSLTLSPTVVSVISRISGNHPGIVSKFLLDAYNHFKVSQAEETPCTDDEEITEFLQSREMVDAVAMDTRVAPLWRKLEAEERDCITKVLLRLVKTVPSADEGKMQVYAKLVVDGVLTQACPQPEEPQREQEAAPQRSPPPADRTNAVSNVLQFASPFIEWIYARRLFSNSTVASAPKTLAEAVRLAIAAIDPEVLWKACQDGHKVRLVERTVTMEFYRALSAQLPSYARIVPERAVYDKDKVLVGFVDFWIYSRRTWAIETLVNGKGPPRVLY